MQREVIKWLQSLDLTTSVQNPKRDFASGHAAAEIVAHYSGTRYISLQRLPNGVSTNTKRDIWLQVYIALQKLHCQSVTPSLIDAVLRREPNAALAVLERLYEHFTGLTLPMRGLDAVGTARDAYVPPRNAAATAKLQTVTHQGNVGVEKAAAADVATANASHATLLRDGASPFPTHATGHAAVNRQDVVLDRPKYAPAAEPQRAHGRSIMRQHEMTSQLQADREGIKRAAALPAHEMPSVASTLTWPGASTKSKAVADEEEKNEVGEAVPLAAVYRGRFYREPQVSSSFPGGRVTKANQRGAQRRAKDRILAHATAASHDHEEHASSHTAGAYSATSTSSEYTVSGSGGAAQRLRVNVHSAALDAALAERNGTAQFQERAAALSCELFAQHQFSLRRAISEVLTEVLRGDKQLHHLIERSEADGEEEVLENILGHLIAHRDEIPRVYMQACWEALHQHVDGIVAAVEHSPEEFSYLVESFAFCFSRDAAQVPLLHVSQLDTATGSAAFERNQSAPNFLNAAAAETSAVVPRRGKGRKRMSTAAGAGYAAAASRAAPEAEDSTRKGSSTLRDLRDSPSRGRALVTATAPPSPQRRQSIGEALLTATRRASVTAAAAAALKTSSTTGAFFRPAQRQAITRQRAIVDTREGVDVASALGLLYRVARQLDGTTALYVLQRHVLRVAKPFVLRHGSVAMREAVARVVSAAFMPPKVTGRDGVPASTGEAKLASFLSGEFATFMLGTQAKSHLAAAAASTAVYIAVPPLSAVEETKAVPPGKAAALELQRAYWLVFLYAVADVPFPDVNGAPLPVAKRSSPFAQQVHAAASTCLSSSDVDLRTIGVALTAEYAQRWGMVEEEEPPSSEQGESAHMFEELQQLLSCVFPDLDQASQAKDSAADAAVAPSSLETDSIAWWNVRHPDTWELRLMVLRLCGVLLRGATGALDPIADTGAAVCLSTFTDAGTPSWQLQLALSAAGKFVDIRRAPALTHEWRRILLSLPLPTLPGRLLAYDETPVRLLLAPLWGTTNTGGAATWSELPQHSKTSARPSCAAQTVSNTSNTKNGAFATTSPTESWLVPETGAGPDATPSRTRSMSYHLEREHDRDAGLQIVWGHVLSVYAVLPLNQSWNVCGVLDAMLTSVCDANAGPSSGLHGTEEEETPSAALQLLAIAAALLSPTPRSEASLSRRESGDASPGEDAFWLSVVRRAWPLLQAHNVAVEALEKPQQPEEKELSPPPLASQEDNGDEAEVGVSREDALAILVSLFLRCADEATLTIASAAAAEDWKKMCAFALDWASTVGGGAT